MSRTRLSLATHAYITPPRWRADDLTKGKLKSLGATDGPTLHTVASLAASLTLTTAICPLDVTYTRLLVGDPNAGPLQCVRALLREGGPMALFRGWVPLWARFLPSSVLTFIIYEQVSSPHPLHAHLSLAPMRCYRV